MENSIKSIPKNYGTYLGGLLAVLTVLVYATYLELMLNTWYSIFIMLVIVAFGIVSILKTKEHLEGFISFKQSFTAYFITILFGLLISTAVSYIIFNIIDPEAANFIKEVFIEKRVSMMEGFGAPAEVIADVVDKMEQDNQFSISNIAIGLAGQLVIFSIIGLIVAAIMKKNPEND